MRLSIIALAACGLSAPASARVVSSDPHGLVVQHEVNVAASKEAAWSVLTKVGGWWSKDHTYSGDSGNLSLDVRPGGCFCERFPKGGGIEHARVTMVEPGERIVMTGALGPLLVEGVSGVLDIQVKTAGAGSKVLLTYKAAGFGAGNAADLAPEVDKVLGQQIQLLARRAAGAR